MPEPQLELVLQTIKKGIAYIDWKPSAYELVRDDPKMKRYTPQAIRSLLYRHVLAGHPIDVRPEIRAEHLENNLDHPFWYRAILQVESFRHGLFVEIKLNNEDPKEPYVVIVDAHEQLR